MTKAAVMNLGFRANWKSRDMYRGIRGSERPTFEVGSEVERTSIVGAVGATVGQLFTKSEGLGGVSC